MNASKVLTSDYENKTLSGSGKNKPNSKPIKPNTNPIQTQNKPNTNPIQTQYKPKTNPISKAKKYRASSLQHFFRRLCYFIGIYTRLHKLSVARIVFY